jgi:hypothetical protein
VLEDLHKLHVSLKKVRDTGRIMFPDGSERPNPDVIRVAAHAAILVYEKYVPKLHECEIYAISIGLLLCFSPYSVDVTHDFQSCLLIRS